MTMDFIAAKHQKEMSSSQPIFSLKEKTHDLLIASAKPSKGYPSIYKIADYYSDHTILFGELKTFREELATLNQINKNIPQLHDLLLFIENAIAEEKIYILQ